MNRVAIVGYGFMGKTHYGAWKKAPGAKVVAVCDSNLAQLTAKTVGNVKGAADNSKLPKTMKVYDSFDKMLAAVCTTTARPRQRPHVSGRARCG